MAGPWEQYGQAPAAMPDGPWRSYQQSEQAQAPSAGSGIAATAMDVAKSIPAGIAKGVMGLATLPGNLEALATSGLDWALDKAGKPGLGKAIGKANDYLGAPYTSQDMQRDVEKVTGPLYKPQTTAGKYAETIGEFAPNAAFPGGMVNRAANVVAPAVASEAAGQAAEGTGYEPLARFGGAVAGAIAPSMAGRVVTPFPMSQERARNLAVLDAEGVGQHLTAGQRTGNERLRYFESTTQHTPLAGNRAAQMQDDAAEAFTGAAMARVGSPGARATPQEMDAAFTRIGQQFDELAASNAMQADRQLVQELSAPVRDYQRLVPPSQRSPAVEAYIMDIARGLQANGGRMPGDIYQSLRSQIERDARAAWKSDPQLGRALSGIRGALDDAMERGLQASNSPHLGAWRETRQHYRNLLAIERAATGAGQAAAEGLISPAQLRQAAVGQNRRAYARGNGDFSDLARAGVSIMSPLPNSGTAQRVNAQAMMSMAGGAFAAGGPGAIAGALAPGLAGRALMSRPVQGYLANQRASHWLNNYSRLPPWAAVPMAAQPRPEDNR